MTLPWLAIAMGGHGIAVGCHDNAMPWHGIGLSVMALP